MLRFSSSLEFLQQSALTDYEAKQKQIADMFADVTSYFSQSKQKTGETTQSARETLTVFALRREKVSDNLLSIEKCGKAIWTSDEIDIELSDIC